jgi:hypothetical protein
MWLGGWGSVTHNQTSWPDTSSGPSHPRTWLGQFLFQEPEPLPLQNLPQRRPHRPLRPPLHLDHESSLNAKAAIQSSGSTSATVPAMASSALIVPRSLKSGTLGVRCRDNCRCFDPTRRFSETITLGRSSPGDLRPPFTLPEVQRTPCDRG